MIHRECGVSQDELRGRHGPLPAADRALDGGGDRGVLLPRAAARASTSTTSPSSTWSRSPSSARSGSTSWSATPGRSRSATAPSCRSAPTRRRTSPCAWAPRSGSPCRGRAHGRAGGRRSSASLAPHQGPVPRHRHAGRPAHHRVDHQPRHLDQRRRPGLHRGAAPAALRLRRSPRQRADVLLPPGLRGPGHRGHHEPRAQPDRARLHRHPRPGHRRRDHRHRHLPLQAPGLRHLVVLRGRHRRALHLLPRHRQLRAVPDRRVHRLPGHDHHRRARARSWARSSAPSSSRCCPSSSATPWRLSAASSSLRQRC